MLALYESARQQAIFNALDLHLAQLLTERAEMSEQQTLRLFFLVCYLSAQTRAGHVCLDLQTLAEGRLFYGRDMALFQQFRQALALPTLTDWQTLLQQCCCVGDGAQNTPLVLQADRLYFQRLWLDEVMVAEYFYQASQTALPLPATAEQLLTQLFPQQESDINWQKLAVMIALTRQAAIISGGPGTGKTTTVAKLLVALLSDLKPDAALPRIVLAAPTGKAAARLTESLNQAIASLPLNPQSQAAMPKEALTLHRLLGAQPNQRQFLYHQQNPLHLDVLIIDEASMVDLSMMASVLAALPRKARLILLGDREQLSSVEAGAVLGDLCSFADHGYSQARVAELNLPVPSQQSKATVADSLCLLRKSYRFHAGSGIGQLANAVRSGDGREALHLLESADYADIALNPLATTTDYQLLLQQIVDNYRLYLQAIQQQAEPAEILQAFNQFRVLAALREGGFGVSGLNRQIEAALQQAGLINHRQQDVWYAGRPVMILKNNHHLGLYNGDIGMSLFDAEQQRLRVYFRLADGSVTGFSPYRLPEHDTAYAMTVHKSQGSEFNHTLLVLPNQPLPLLNRSLLYTAITRAKQQITIFAQPEMLLKAIQTQVERQSGLAEYLRQRCS